MAYSLRLSPALEALAREKSDYLGVSLNALICVALDAYLSRSDGSQHLSERPANDLPPVVPVVNSVNLSRKEKKALYEKTKLERKRLSDPF